MKHCTLLPLFLSATLVACGTPQPIKDQAAHTVGLMSELDKSLRDFDRVQTNVLTRRLRSVASSEADLGFAQRETRLIDAVRAANGNAGPATVMNRINLIADEIAEQEKLESERRAKLDAEFAKLLKPIASSSEKLNAAQRTVVPFTKDLAKTEQISELRSVVRKVQKDVAENKKKIQAAETADMAEAAKE